MLPEEMFMNKSTIFFKSGFLLLEAMVSLALLLAMVLGIAFYQATVSKWQTAAHQRWKGTMLARKVLDSLIHDSNYACPLRQDEFTIEVVRADNAKQRAPLVDGPNIIVGGRYNYADVMVKVAWQLAQVTQSVTLYSGLWYMAKEDSIGV